MDHYAIVQQSTLDAIARHCPRALYTYTTLMGRADDGGALKLSREQITHDMSESYARFRNNVKSLALEGLLEWHESPTGISIQLVLPDVDE